MKKKTLFVVAVGIPSVAIIVSASFYVVANRPKNTSMLSSTLPTVSSSEDFSNQVIAYEKAVLEPPSNFHMVDSTSGWLMNANGIYHTTDGGKMWTNVTQSFWSQISAKPQLAFVDADHAYVAFETRPQHNLATGLYTSSDILFYATSDGGGSWTETHVTGLKESHDSFALPALSFTDISNGKLYVINSGGAGSVQLTLMQTADGGKTWNVAKPSILLADGAFTFRFIDTQNGYLFTNGSNYGNMLQLSADGGKHWASHKI